MQVRAFERYIPLTKRKALPVGFLCSGIQFYVLLSPYLYFISFLYLHLYVFGVDALVS